MDRSKGQAPPNLTEFLNNIKSPDGDTRIKAWQTAGPMGAAAIAPLGEIAASNDQGQSKAATEAMASIAHHAARPGSNEAAGVSQELLKIAASDKPRMVRANAVHLVGFIGDPKALPGLARLFADKDIREDARIAMERIPGSAATDALKKAQKESQASGSDYAASLTQSIHNRQLTSKTAGTGAPAK